MRYVAIGDLMVDCYYRINEDGNLEILRIDGGSSEFNVISNLAYRGEETAVISGCGNDMYGNIAIESLRKTNVDVGLVKKSGFKTRVCHLISSKEGILRTKSCPICKKATWYDKSIVDEEYYLQKVKKDDVLIFDSLKKENIPILLNLSNEKVIDIGRLKRLEGLSDEEILKLLVNNNIQILQLNESVEKYLLDRFGFSNIKDIYKTFNPNLLIVTRGKKGSSFVANGYKCNKNLIAPKQEIDDTGAGDAFFSMFIQKYYDNSKNVDRKFINSTFKLATELTSTVVSNIGARGHLYDGYYLGSTNSCICNL